MKWEHFGLTVSFTKVLVFSWSKVFCNRSFVAIIFVCNTGFHSTFSLQIFIELLSVACIKQGRSGSVLTWVSEGGRREDRLQLTIASIFKIIMIVLSAMKEKKTLCYENI